MLVLLAFLVCVLPMATGEFAVTLSQTDLKYLRNDSTRTYFSPVASKAAVDGQNNLIYAAGGTQIDVLKYNGNMELDVLYTEKLPKEIQSIQVCGGFISILYYTYSGGMHTRNGYLDIFPPFNTSLNYVFQPIKTISVSSEVLLMHHVITQDCKKYIISMDNNVVIISFDGVDGPNYQDRFERTDIRIDDITNLDEVKKTYFRYYGESIVRLYRISINADETRAYISATINNAMVIIDLTQQTAIGVTGMGAKDWSEDGGTHGLDCSSDGVINITNVPLLTFYQPYDIQSVRLGNDDILLTINSGRGDFWPTTADSITFETSSSHLQDVALACPKLEIEDYNILTDADQNGKMDKVIGFGGRGMSLFNATDFQIITDTESAIEESVRDTYPLSFNKRFSFYIEASFDYASDDFGAPLWSTAATFVCNNQRLVTIAGGDALYVFTVDVNRMDQGFQFHSLYDGVADRSSNSTFKQLYDNHRVSLKGIRSLQIIKVSPDKLMLVASGDLTGTINVFEIVVTDCPGEAIPQTNAELKEEDCTRCGQDNDSGSKRSRKDFKNSSSSGDDDDDSSKRSRKYKNKRKGSKNSGSSEGEDN